MQIVLGHVLILMIVSYFDSCSFEHHEKATANYFANYNSVMERQVALLSVPENSVVHTYHDGCCLHNGICLFTHIKFKLLDCCH